MRKQQRQIARHAAPRGISVVDLNRLRNCSREEITQILRQIGFPLTSITTPDPTTEQIDVAIRREAQRLLSTVDGKKRLDVQLDRLVTEDARRRLNTPEIQNRVAACTARLSAEQICNDDDLLSRVCSEAVRSRVHQWLNSSRGQVTYKRLLVEAVEQGLLQHSQQQGRSWIEKYLEEHGDADANHQST